MTEPRTVGRFEIVEVLDEAGPIATFVARDPTLGRPVLLRVAPAADEPAEPLRRESIGWPRLDIPDLLSLHEVGRDGDRTIAVYQHVVAVPLPRWLAEPRRPAALSAACASGARVLAAVHAAETVHGAVVAGCLWIASDGHVVIGDHGLLAALGTPARGTPADDQRAYCAAWRAALDASPRQPVPRELTAALARGVDPDPSRRWPTLTALADTLTRPPRGRGRLVVGGAILGVAAGATAVYLAASSSSTPSPSPSQSPSLSLSPPPVSDLTTFAGCSDYPQFVDDDTLVFSHRGDRKDGLYAVDLTATAAADPRWLYDGPGLEMMTQPSATPGAVLFLAQQINQVDAATGAHQIIPQDFDYFLNPFVAGHGDALFFVGMSGRGLFRRTTGAAQLLATVPAGEILMHMGLSPDGRFVALSGGRGLYLIDVSASGAEPVELEPRSTGGTPYQRALVSRGGTFVLYPRRDGIVHLDPATGAERVLLPGAVAPGGLTLSPDGRTLVWSDCRSRATARDITDAAAPRELFRESLSWPGLGADGSLVFTLDLPSGAIAARRLADGRILSLSPPELGVAMTPALRPDGAEIAFTIDGLAPGIYVAPADGSGSPRLVGPGGLHYPMWLPDGRLAFARTDDAGLARLWAIPADGGEPVSIHPRSRRLAEVIRSTGEVLLVDGGFEHLWLWDPATGKEVAVALPADLDHHVLAVVRASPDGSTALITTGMFDQVWQIDLRGGDRTRQLRKGDLNAFAGALYTADGHLVMIENHAEGRLHRAEVMGIAR